MAKKRNIYGSMEYESVKDELTKTVEDLNRFDIEILDDIVDWKSGINGILTPYIISSREDQIKTVVLILTESIQQLKIISQHEGLTTFVIKNLECIREKVGEIQGYYKELHPVNIVDRFVKLKRTTKKGVPIELKLEAATRDQQIKVRSTVQRQILNILPILGQLEANKEEIELKGGKNIPTSLIGLI